MSMEAGVNKRKKTVAAYTLGCKVNQYETNGMISKFKDKGYSIIEFDKKADIYVINTCTVTNMSDRKSRQIIRRAKNTNKNSIVVVTGCYAQTAIEDVSKIKEIDLIIGNNEKKDVVEIIEKYIKNNNEKLVTEVSEQMEYVDFGKSTYMNRTRLVIKVEDGCDNFCSYCIIPYAKGRVRSRKMDSVISEITEAVKNGIKEVVITGIEISSYGKDFKEDITLINLLEEINSIEGLRRIRLGSLEPNLITKEFVTRLKKLDKICDHFHLSLQSGSDETLKRMNRKYSMKEFKEKVELLRETFVRVSLTTDIIVGFPGETEEEFKDTYESLKQIKFSKMHIFKYSSRKGTRASKMENQIDEKVKEIRSKKLIELSNSNEGTFIKQYLDKEVEVLFEQKEDGYFKGHTTNYIIVKSLSKDNLENKIEKVKIKESQGIELIGNIV